MQLGSGIAVAVISSYSSESTPSLETSICLGPKKNKKNKKTKKKKKERKKKSRLFTFC